MPEELERAVGGVNWLKTCSVVVAPKKKNKFQLCILGIAEM